MPVEVAPIAHYHMGGIRVNADYADAHRRALRSGEAVGGANGANRLPGRITEALAVRREDARRCARGAIVGTHLGRTHGRARNRIAASNCARETANQHRQAIVELQALMSDHAGPLRTGPKLVRAFPDQGIAR